ncbi:hypothetical protein [Nonomuraea salmonea]|uniref:hypothetical protein n=1 Tax=Nonomuraea salmonea TaxID=46181 RepID=UPI002FEC64B9
MKIVDAKVVLTSPGRNFVTLRIETDEGVTGLGDATLNGRELAVVSYLTDHVVPLLLGTDPHRIEDTWQSLYRGAYWRRGPVTMAAIAAVDVALWDIKAKVAGLPLYQLLGGASRERVRTYGHASGRDLPELFDSIRARLEQGYQAIRVQTGVPGLKRVYGVRHTVDTAAGPRPVVEDWDTAAYLRSLPKVFDAVRQEFGPDLPLLHDAHHRLTPPCRRPGWARTWSRTTCSGWRTARPPRTRRACGWCAPTPRRRWPSVRSSTPSTTTGR